ncbi:MAG: hypothetical protein SGJ00_01920 [bacterium]|nr:hypothetical protein [bacterium]
MNTNFVVMAYSIYLPLTIGLTIYVANVLFNNGRIFMVDIFKGREEIADATNHLFKVGFYLLNVGFALIMMYIAYEIESTRSLIEVLSNKVGWFSIYLGLMLFLNLFLFFRGKRKAKENAGITNN